MYKLPELELVRGLTHSFSTISDGNMSYLWGDEQKVIENRERFLKGLSIDPNSCAVMSILNTDVITEITPKTEIGIGKNSPIKTDAFITTEKNKFLFLVIADCLPVIIYDPMLKILALAHCGWKSTEAKLVGKVVDFLKEHFHTDPSNLLVGIGPGIHKESYKMANPAERQLAGWSDFLLNTPNGQTAIDIVGYNKSQLISAGVKEENIEISDIDNAADPRFFSHHRSKETGELEGRFAAVVGMV